MKRTIGNFLLGAMLLTPVLLLADDDDHHERKDQAQRYYDKKHHDYHEWNDREGLAYHRYYQDQHREYREFNTVTPRDQRDYWNWRHNHSDAVLQLDVH